MNYGGHEWVLTDPHDEFHKAQLGRFQALTWRFGSIYQAKVLIEYEHANSFLNEVEGHKNVRMELEPGKTLQEAMQRCLDGIAHFEDHGPPSPDEEMARCFADYPSLYKTRFDVLAQWWFTDGGDGLDWLDGAIFSGTITTKAERVNMARLEEQLRELEDIQRHVWEALPDEARGRINELRPKDREPTERPLPDDGEPRDIQLRPRARILRIPPDLRADWRASGVEAANLLITRAIDPDVRHAGEEILRGLV